MSDMPFTNPNDPENPSALYAIFGTGLRYVRQLHLITGASVPTPYSYSSPETASWWMPTSVRDSWTVLRSLTGSNPAGWRASTSMRTSIVADNE
jgi:hypothetical protein